eukprot:6585143-Alexandrium_andersonii.AAC.1
MSAALQLSPTKLGRKLQVGPRRRHTPGDLLLVHPQVVRVDIPATPIRAWRAANQQERPARGDESDRPLA